jgi:hypothetical protein
LNGGIFELDESAVCRTLGIKILRSAEDEEMLEHEFMRLWNSDAPMYMTPSLDYLLGNAILKRRDNLTYIQHISIWELSGDVSTRFQQLFALHPEWTRADLQAYLR